MADSRAVLVCTLSDRIHDGAFARDELRLLLESFEGVRVEVAEDYTATALDDADILVTYICDSVPGEAETAAVRRYLERGGRVFALHASIYLPDESPLPSVLGGRFLTHPPYGPFRVELTKSDDPMLDGIEPFDVEDELYCIDAADDIEVLLHARWGGTDERYGFEVPEADQPMLYRRRVGAGEVLYLALGHANPEGAVQGREVLSERRGAWQSPVFRELVKRGIAWVVRQP